MKQTNKKVKRRYEIDLTKSEGYFDIDKDAYIVIFNGLDSFIPTDVKIFDFDCDGERLQEGIKAYLKSVSYLEGCANVANGYKAVYKVI